MPNPFLPRDPKSSGDSSSDSAGGRSSRSRSTTRRRAYIAGGAIAVVGALVGTGFAAQAAQVTHQANIVETDALTAAAELRSAQLATHGVVLTVRAERDAEVTLASADKVLKKAEGIADASELSSSVAALGDYTMLAPQRVFELVDETKSTTEKVAENVAEAERKAKEKAAQEAAAKAKAEAAAVEAAAAEEAVAQEAAAQEAAAQEAAAAGSAGSDGAEETSGDPAPSRPSGPANPSGAQAIARDMAASQYGWGAGQFGCLVSVWNYESGWNVYASNPGSGAYGIPQALPGNKMASAGADWQSSASTQIAWGLGYIAGSYGTPCGAWDHINAAGWY